MALDLQPAHPDHKETGVIPVLGRVKTGFNGHPE